MDTWRQRIHAILNPATVCVPKQMSLKELEATIRDKYGEFASNKLGTLVEFIEACDDLEIKKNIVCQDKNVWGKQWKDHEKSHRSLAQEIVDNQFSELKDRSEDSTLKFRESSKPYFAIGTNGSTKFALDIVSMWNTPRRSDSYLILGISSSSDYQHRLIGLTDDDLSKTDSDFQKLFDESQLSFSNRPEFQYVVTKHVGQHFGVIIVYSSEGKLPALETGRNKFWRCRSSGNVEEDTRKV